jgi:hypothetical protein
MAPGLLDEGKFPSHDYTQNEPFMLDVDFSIDDFIMNINDSPKVDSKEMLTQSSSSSSSSFPKDIRNYVSNSFHEDA